MRVVLFSGWVSRVSEIDRERERGGGGGFFAQVPCVDGQSPLTGGKRHKRAFLKGYRMDRGRFEQPQELWVNVNSGFEVGAEMKFS